MSYNVAKPFVAVTQTPLRNMRGRKRGEAMKKKKKNKKPQGSIFKKLSFGVVGITFLSIAVLSVTLISLNVTINTGDNINNINTTIENHVHNHVVDNFVISHSEDENGSTTYTAHPSRYGSPRSVVSTVEPGQTTTVVFRSNPK